MPHPLQRPFLALCADALELPDIATLNALAAARGLQTGAGHALRFEACQQSSDYEARAYQTGLVATRAGSWHDAFNALVWLRFPHSKRLLNTLHVAALTDTEAEAEDIARDNVRGPLRDALTQFDECGVIVAGSAPDLWQALGEHRWQHVFVTERRRLLETTRFVVFGHGSLDSLRAPFPGLCGKALFIESDQRDLSAIDGGDLSALDLALERRVGSADFLLSQSGANLRPWRWQPLPLLGIPGATSANEDPAYYADARQFRPR